MTEESTGVVVDDEEERHEFANGATFATTDDGQLHVMDSAGELVAMFAAGQWRTAQIKR